jgi:predicted ATP-grasp superfamily ATP-dependent carboligase
VNGLAAIRSLGRAGAEVIAIDYGRSALGFHSRYARPVLCPHPRDDEPGFVRFLARLGDTLDEPAPLFPTNDELLNAIARNRDELDGRFLFPFPGWDVLGPVQRKRFQVERAAALGVPHPRTRFEATDELGYPVLVKPSDPAPFQREFRCHAFRCESRAELDAALERAAPYDPLVQEFIPGGDDELYSLGSYLSPSGEALGLFCGRKLRQTPPGVGTCRVGESVWVDEVVEQGLRYLRGLGLYGISQVEFKRDPRDGTFKLMEVNPRLWQWHGLAAACGVDLPRIAYDDLRGASPRPVVARGRSKRWAITLVAGEPVAFPRPPFVDAVFAHDDPKPALVQAARVTLPPRARRLAREVLRRAPRRQRAAPAGHPA